MSLFSAKHYLWLADTWADLLDSEPLATDREVLNVALERFVERLAEQSPGFEPALFRQNIRTRLRHLQSEPRRGHCNG